MLYIKKTLKNILFSFSSLLIMSIIFTILNYLDIINSTIMNISYYIIIFISFLIGGLKTGQMSVKNGLLNGLYFGIINSIIFLILNLILNSFSLSNIFNYIIIISSGIIGSIIGINKKNK